MRSHFSHYLFLSFLLVLLPAAGCTLSSDGQSVTAFVNVNLVPMTSEAVLPEQTVLVRKNRIEAVGPSWTIPVPRGARVIDGKGAWLMPGLADMHMHTKDDWSGPAWPANPLKLYLANGVTTIRCLGPLGASPDYILKWREEVRGGHRRGPTIYTSGPIIYGPVPDPAGAVQEQKGKGYDFIKVYSYLTRQEFQEVIKEAKVSDIYTAGHIPFKVGLDGVLAEGMDEIAHIEELDFEFFQFEPDLELGPLEMFRRILAKAAEQYEGSLDLGIEELERRYGKVITEVAGKLKTSETPICTTLTIGEGIVEKLGSPETFAARPENRLLPASYLERFRVGMEKHRVLFRGFEELAAFKHNMEKILAHELNKAGVTMLLGTDAGTGMMGIVPGYSIHDELRILVECGLTPYEAVKTGTINAARVVGNMTREKDIGSIEPGKRADLILLRGDPLKDLLKTKEPLGVMAAGRWYPEIELQEMLRVK